MAFDSTWGGADANSYISLEEADTFINEEILDPCSSWNNLNPQQQQAALRSATRDINQFNFIGSPFYSTQALKVPVAFAQRWPENLSQSETSLESIDHARMRAAIQRAVCYQAFYLLQQRSNGGDNVHAELQAQGIESWSEEQGPVKETFKYGRSNAGKVGISREAYRELKPWLTGRPIYRA